MKKIKSFILKYKVTVGVCVLMLAFGFGYWIWATVPTHTTIGDDIIVKGSVGIGTTSPEATLQVDGTMKVFGAWQTKEKNTVYQAETDGLVLAWTGRFALRLVGRTDSSNPPTTIRTANTGDHADSATGQTGITMPVRKGDYWRVDEEYNTGTVTVYWLPLGI